jgi:hypothetical protein
VSISGLTIKEVRLHYHLQDDPRLHLIQPQEHLDGPIPTFLTINIATATFIVIDTVTSIANSEEKPPRRSLQELTPWKILLCWLHKSCRGSPYQCQKRALMLKGRGRSVRLMIGTEDCSYDR